MLAPLQDDQGKFTRDRKKGTVLNTFLDPSRSDSAIACNDKLKQARPANYRCAIKLVSTKGLKL